MMYVKGQKEPIIDKKNCFKKNSRVGFVCIEKSFDTIFNMGYGSGKSPMDERVKLSVPFILSH